MTGDAIGPPSPASCEVRPRHAATSLAPLVRRFAQGTSVTPRRAGSSRAGPNPSTQPPRLWNRLPTISRTRSRRRSFHRSYWTSERRLDGCAALQRDTTGSSAAIVVRKRLSAPAGEQPLSVGRPPVRPHVGQPLLAHLRRGCQRVIRCAWLSSNIIRTTVDIDDPISRAVKAIHEKEGRSMGAVVSELLADALTRRRTGRARPAFRWISRPMRALLDLSDRDAVCAVRDRDQSRELLA